MVALCSAQARAQPAAKKVEAEALFDRGLELMRNGEFVAACPVLEQSQREDPGIGTLLYIAECYEKLGRSASAWATFREASSAAEAAGQMERAVQGRERAQALEPVLSRITLSVAAHNQKVEGFIVRRSSEHIAPALWGVPIPVDPGEHVIEASAPGHRTARRIVRVEPGPYSTEIVIGPLAPLPASTPEPASKKVSSATPTPSRRDSVHEPTSSVSGGVPASAWVVGVVGIAGLGVGGYFGLRAARREYDARDLCPRSPACDDPRAVTLTEEAKDAALVSNIGFAVGVVGAVSAVGLTLLASSGNDAKEVSVSLSQGGGRLEVRTVF
jgi:serine/threonine-protein kinase